MIIHPSLLAIGKVIIVNVKFSSLAVNYTTQQEFSISLFDFNENMNLYTAVYSWNFKNLVYYLLIVCEGIDLFVCLSKQYCNNFK